MINTFLCFDYLKKKLVALTTDFFKNEIELL